MAISRCLATVTTAAFEGVLCAPSPFGRGFGCTTPPEISQSGMQMIRANWNFFRGLDLNASVWRKHTQFAMLQRPHAQLALREQHVERAFARLCFDEKEQRRGFDDPSAQGLS